MICTVMEADPSKISKNKQSSWLKDAAQKQTDWFSELGTVSSLITQSRSMLTFIQSYVHSGPYATGGKTTDLIDVLFVDEGWAISTRYGDCVLCQVSKLRPDIGQALAVR